MPKAQRTHQPVIVIVVRNPLVATVMTVYMGSIIWNQTTLSGSTLKPMQLYWRVFILLTVQEAVHQATCASPVFQFMLF